MILMTLYTVCGFADEVRAGVCAVKDRAACTEINEAARNHLWAFID